MTPVRQLRPGARLILAGQPARLLFCNECRARVRLDRPRLRRFRTRDGKTVTIRQTVEMDVSPHTEVEVR